VFVHDVARANLCASTDPWRSPSALDDVAFNVGTGIETSVNALVRTLFEATGRSVEVETQPARSGELLRSSVAIGKSGVALGWQPEVRLREGLRRTYDWILTTEA